MKCLQVARSVDLPDWYLGAGFLRNAIWDYLHEKAVMTPLNDVDLVYLDAQDRDIIATESLVARRLADLCPEVEWEVRNQARMHLRHNHQPYESTTQALSNWVEIPTCVGVRLNHNDELELTAPFGLEHNWSLEVRINPDDPRPEVFRERIRSKGWLEVWPGLKIISPEA